MSAEQIKEQLCHLCYNELELIIETKEKLKAKLIKKIEGEINPTFDVELDESSEIEYDAYWICTKCSVRSYDANKDLVYDEINDLILYPAYDPDSKLGHKGAVYQHPFSPNIGTSVVKQEEKLPTIVKASTGGVIVKEPVNESVWEGGYID